MNYLRRWYDILVAKSSAGERDHVREQPAVHSTAPAESARRQGRRIDGLRPHGPSGSRRRR